ncbi:MAG TPA: SdrD B-like domain-containing protein [Kiritimatiellia bacterium]|nr:SdrD B-like domain-containing protein [Kiritimatiellia bacterium]
MEVEDCGDLPPFIVPFKTFVSATEPDVNGDFSAIYTLTMVNVGGSAGTYHLSDKPDPDTNVTVNAASVTGHVTTNFTGAGPYIIVTNEPIAAGVSHIYTLTLDLTLSSGALFGTNQLTECGSDGDINQPYHGLFNEVTLTFGTNNLTITTNACGNITPTIRLITDPFCSNDAPYLAYTVIPVGFTPTNGVQLSWITTNNVTVQVLTNQPLSGVLLWPGAVISNGLPVAWPGWSFTNGVWVEVDDGLRPFMTLLAEINPTSASQDVYPPATPDCDPNPPIRIGDFVWEDINGNGLQDLGEPGLSNVVVILYDFTNGVSGITTTDVNGAYAFEVRAGSYTVEFVLPPGFEFVPQYIGTNAAIDSDADVITGLSDLITLSAGEVDDTIDAGMIRRASITGQVREDLDGDGDLLDPDPGIPGVIITLLNSNSVVVGVTTTDVNGAYAFTNLLPGSYTVVETDPVGYYSTADAVGPNDNMIPVTLISGQNSTGNDFLDARYAAVGDRVWLDFNENGIQDISEPGFPGMRLTLYNSNNVAVAVTTSATSGVLGYYSFTNLIAGNYSIRVTLTPGNALSPQFQGGDPTRDSDFNQLNARTPVFYLAPGVNNTNVDAGIYRYLVFAQVDSVSGNVDGGEARLVWSTESEFGTAGWLIEREVNGDWVRVSEYLPAVGTVLEGGNYTWVDADATPGNSYRYRIIEVEVQGTERISGPYDINYPKVGRTAVAATSSARFSFTGKAESEPVAKSSARSIEPAGNSAGVVEAVKVGIKKSGLYVVTAAEIAEILQLDASLVATSDIRVENLGVAVPALRVDGDVVFYGRSYETIYTDVNVYRISIGTGRSVADSQVGPATGAGAVSFDDIATIEKQLVLRPDLFANDSEDIWLWSQLISGFRNEFNTAFDLPGLLAGSGGSLTVKLKGNSPHQHKANILLNGVLLGEVEISGNQHVVTEFNVPAGGWNSAGNQIKVVTVAPAPGVFNSFYVDGFGAAYQRRFVAESDHLLFPVSGGSVAVGGFSSPNIEVWNVSDSLNPVRLAGVSVHSGSDGYGVSFQANESGDYIASASPRSPDLLAGWYANDLKNNAQHVDYLVVYGPGLENGAQALAADRAGKGLLSKAVPVDAIYDAFNYGIRDGRTLKTFLGYTYRQWLTSPRYVTLVGAGSLDYRNYTGHADSLVPTPPASGLRGVFASDHGIGDLTGDGNLEIVVSRIPVTTAAQLSAYIAKLQSFEVGGEWRDNALVASDYSDYSGSYLSDADRIATKISGRSITVASADTLGDADASQAVKSGINSGSELTVYIGHGNMQRFAQSGILKSTDVPLLLNNDKPGIITALGCLMGNFGLPGNPSIGEKLVTSSAGASALFGSASMVNNHDGVMLGESLVDDLYQQQTARLGDAWVNAKNSITDDGGRMSVKTYQMLGDSALAVGDVNAPRGGPQVTPSRPSYDEWVAWAFGPAWQDHGLCTDPDCDPDGDGMSNWQEYIAGTDPTDVDSDFVVIKVTHLADGRTEVIWPSVPGRSYRIERAESAIGPYQVVAASIAATVPENKWIDNETTGISIYRVSIAISADSAE